MMGQVLYTPLRRIQTSQGEVRHALKVTDQGFVGFGEVYFSEVIGGKIKGWKRHRRMTMNLVVVIGTIRFTLHDGGDQRRHYVMSAEDDARYGRLTIPPGLWMAFQGIGSCCNLLMNCASCEHDPDEAETRSLESFGHHLPAVHYA